MRKITALVAYLRETTGLPAENFNAYADKGELAPSGRHLGFVRGEDGSTPAREQIEAGVWKYDAVIQIERYAGDGPALLALILAWLADNDPDRDGLADPEVDAEINDADTADLEISVELEERIVLIEDAAGDVAYRSKRWSVLPTPQITPARSVSVEAAHA